MINLFYNYFEDSNQSRAEELVTCLRRNIANRNIDTVYVVTEEHTRVELNGPVVIRIDKRPLFRDMFRIIESRSGTDDINIVINTDCFLDEEDTRTVSGIARNEAWCILRTEIESAEPVQVDENLNKKNLKKHSRDMQDGWVFRGKPPSTLWLDFHMGVPGCDNRLAYEFEKAGYVIRNPYLFVKLYHLHKTKVRRYSERQRVPGPYAFPVLMESIGLPQ